MPDLAGQNPDYGDAKIVTGRSNPPQNTPNFLQLSGTGIAGHYDEFVR